MIQHTPTIIISQLVHSKVHQFQRRAKSARRIWPKAISSIPRSIRGCHVQLVAVQEGSDFFTRVQQTCLTYTSIWFMCVCACVCWDCDSGHGYTCLSCFLIHDRRSRRASLLKESSNMNVAVLEARILEYCSSSSKNDCMMSHFAPIFQWCQHVVKS